MVGWCAQLRTRAVPGNWHALHNRPLSAARCRRPRMQGHSAPVTSLTTFSPAPGQLLLASTAGDGDVCVWECAPGAAGAAQAAWRLRQRIHVGAQLQNCAALARLPQDPDW